MNLPKLSIAAKLYAIFALTAIAAGALEIAEEWHAPAWVSTAFAVMLVAAITGAILVVLITVLGPLSGAHFNPVVSLVFSLRRELPWTVLGPYVAAQLVGAIVGAILANAMFDLPLLQVSNHVRTGTGQLLSEAVATFGLVLTILAGIRFRQTAVPWLVGLYITAAYWFTASTSFANPAVTLAWGSRIDSRI